MDQAPRMASIVIVDIEHYSARPDPVQADLRNDLYALMRDAVSAAGLSGETVIPADRGDAIMLFFPTASPVNLLGALVTQIDAALRLRNERSSELYRMRLRMTVHGGLIAQDENGWVGSAINDAARLIDAPPVRRGLIDHADAALSVIVGEEMYRMVIATGHRSLAAAEWTPAQAVVKDFDRPAWVRVPGARPVAPGDTSASAPTVVDPRIAETSSGPDAATPAGTPPNQPVAEAPLADRIGNYITNGTFTNSTIVGGDQHVHRPDR